MNGDIINNVPPYVKQFFDQKKADLKIELGRSPILWEVIAMYLIQSPMLNEFDKYRKFKGIQGNVLDIIKGIENGGKKEVRTTAKKNK